MDILRDTAAMPTKLDELIRAVEGAHQALLDLEEMEESDLEAIRKEYEEPTRDARQILRDGQQNTDTDGPSGDVAERATGN